MSASVSEVTSPGGAAHRPVSSRASSRTGQHSLQLPGSEQQQTQPQKATTTSGTKIPQVYLRTLFEDNLDELQDYCELINLYGIRLKSFSTNDIVWACANEPDDSSPSGSHNLLAGSFGNISNSNVNYSNNPNTGTRKYLSECDLISYSRHQNHMKDNSNDYITYSCSTLAICGDTVHNSSQLPSPQTQSIRHLANSFVLSDLDLIKSLSKKMRTDCIRERKRELLRALEPGTITSNEFDRINGVQCKPIFGQRLHGIDTTFGTYGGLLTGTELLTDKGDILIQVIDYGSVPGSHKPIQAVHKKDRELFVLNWLQNVESITSDQLGPAEQ